MKARMVAVDTDARVVCDVWTAPLSAVVGRGATEQGDYAAWHRRHVDHGCVVVNLFPDESVPAVGEAWTSGDVS